MGFIPRTIQEKQQNSHETIPYGKKKKSCTGKVLKGEKKEEEERGAERKMRKDEEEKEEEEKADEEEEREACE